MAAAFFLWGSRSDVPAAIQAFAPRGWSGIGLALIPVLFAYDGWNGFTAMGAEVKDPGRSIPVSLAAGVMAVVAVYLVVNAAYFLILPFDVLQKSSLVAADAVSRIAGPAGASLVAGLVMLSTFGSLNATVITEPRIYFAMAERGLFFPSVARVHSQWGTPYVAIAVSSSLAILYVFVSTFEQLAEAFVLGVWPFLALAVGAVFVLRRARPDIARPYRTTGYPAVPIVFIVASVAMMLNALYRHPMATVLSLGISLLGLPVYYAWRAIGVSTR
jgi:basic amino acid/polyamine antiporter, APA family